MRLLNGTPPIESGLPVPASRAWNLSLAYHRTMRNGEVYVVYGDANALDTLPRLTVKIVRYIGAQKGT
jgi:hypothetical protein